MKIFLITLFCVFFKKIFSYNSTIVSHNIFSFTLNNSYIIYRYYLSSKYSSNTLMIYCQKRNKGGMLYYYQKESTIKNYPDYPLSFKNSIQFYPLINYWRYEFLNVKPGFHFFLFSSSENNSISDICKIICFEEEYRIYSNIFYDSFKSSGIFQLKFIVNSTYRIQIGKCLDSP